ncbi:hypothetical protein HWV62_29559 [Athelia sp. TMB]|nr:hypothetical protein HWV62_29559 [Athelia sp. TMB]
MEAPDPANVRIITTLGHVDHGKTTLMDALLAANNIISTRMAGKMRYLDSREDEQERGITMESSAVSLKFQVKDGEGRPPIFYFINMIDTPGHVDFTSEVSTASRLCDGALVLVDVVEGVCTQTITVLRQAWQDRLRPILVINKFDRLITELKLAPVEAYHHLSRLIEQVNAVMGSLFAGDRMEDDLRWREERERRLANKKDAYADQGEATANEADEFLEKDDEDIYFAPEKGNVIFASAIDGWGFRVGRFAQLYSAKLGFKEANLRRVLWGDFFLDPKTKKVISYKHLRGRNLKPLFVSIVLDNLWAIYDAVVLNPNSEKVAKIVTTLNLKIPPRDLKSKDSRHLLSLIFSQWLSLSTCVIQAAIDIVPAPAVAQASRIPKILYPDIWEQTIEPKNKLEKDLFTSNSDKDACVTAYVSKMFVISSIHLPENKKKTVTAEEMRNRAKGNETAKPLVDELPISSTITPATAKLEPTAEFTPIVEKGPEPAEETEDAILGFARIYSGTIRVGTSVYCVLPKYRASLGPAHPQNARYILKATVEGLYIMMGRELSPVDSVRAGNTFAIRGLEGKVWRSATLCSPDQTGVRSGEEVNQQQDCLINLGGVKRSTSQIVRVAVEPVHPADMPKLVQGLKLLGQSDPCVETFQQSTGEHVVLGAGELHLERCLKDLSERFAKIEIQASKPIVPFRETAIKGSDMQPPKTANAPRGTVNGSAYHDLITFTIRAAPLPQDILRFILDNVVTLKKLQHEHKTGDTLTDEEAGDIEDEEGTNIHGDVVRRPSSRPDQFWDALDKVCREAGGDWADIAGKIWSFGPQRAGGCILIDARKDSHQSLKKRLNRSHLEADENGTHEFDIDTPVETGFQLATFQGPLCSEPVEGLAYFVESLKVDKDGFDKEIAQNRTAAVTGSAITAIRDACKNGLLDWSPRLMMAMYACDIQASSELISNTIETLADTERRNPPADVLGKVYGVIAKRRGRVVAEEMKEGTSFFTVSALLPVVESFGFADDIRKRTSGAASPQLIFSGYEMFDQDPFWVPTTDEELEDLGEKADRANVAKGYMDSVRERKGMFVDRKIVEFSEKQRTLKRPSLCFFYYLCVGAMATAIYDTRHAFTGTMTIQHSLQQQPDDEQYITTFFCRALYDYQSQDSSSLSFRKDDIIEVLTQLESGWWDGLLGEERGWFPSNYVTIISEEQAEAEFSGSEFHGSQQSDVSHSTLTAGQAALNGGSEWMDDDMDHSESRNGLFNELAQTSLDEGSTPYHDFWMPQVTPEGAIYYVNTQTGQISRDLPIEAEGSPSDDLVGLTGSQASSRAGTSLGLALSPIAAGFGLPQQAENSGPWTRRLADDGMSYYFLNTQTGEVRWTAPELGQAGPIRRRAETASSTTSTRSRDEALALSRLRSDGAVPMARNHSQSSVDRLSVYSDDSEFVMDAELSGSAQQQLNDGQRDLQAPQIESPGGIGQDGVVLTSAERLAQSLQESLAAPAPDSLQQLSSVALRTISAVLESVQAHDTARFLDQDGSFDDIVHNVVLSIRNLLYVSAAPSGHISSSVIPGPRDVRDRRDTTASQALLKPAQRKVTATLSKLVLSARAIRYNSGSSYTDTPMRIEGDAEELQRAVIAFVQEVKKCQSQQIQSVAGLKRLHGVFSTANIGLGLVGAGTGGSWKGLGWVAIEERDEAPSQALCTEIVADITSYVSEVQAMFVHFASSIQDMLDDASEHVYLQTQALIARLSSLLSFVANIHIARHVDIDGFRRDEGEPADYEIYTQTVENGRVLIRTLEAATQSLFEDGSVLMDAVQSTRRPEKGLSRRDTGDTAMYLHKLATAIEVNLGVVLQSYEALLAIGHHQADIAQGDYNGSIEWRMSRLSIIDTQFGGSHRPVSSFSSVVDMEMAFQKPGQSQYSERSGSVAESETTLAASAQSRPSALTNGSHHNGGSVHTLVPPSPTGSSENNAIFEDDLPPSNRQPTRGEKLKKLLGSEAPQHYLNIANAEAKPWYLRPTYDEKEILIDPDGTVRGGTINALVERLTAHEHGGRILSQVSVPRLAQIYFTDPTFIKTFLMTYNSFTTLDELFDLLVKRFWIQPPDSLNPQELEEWGKLKQHVIQMRVINTFKSMVVDEDVLEKEDLYILDRIKAFISEDEVIKFAAAKQLLILLERAQRPGDTRVKMTVNTTLQPPPPPIAPKSSKKLKLLDINPLELARQLTILESRLYQKIRPMECLQRSREQKADSNDNIAAVIHTSNRIANWVADSVLNREDSRRRAAVVKQFISVADSCRGIHNFSSMAAIVAGLNSPPIRRLKRTWEQVNARFIGQLAACEVTIDSNKNFTNYRTTLAKISPPCVPFIGVFLTTLTFVQDGSKDDISGNLINFRKRQKASEVIQDIKRWQSHPHNFHSVANVITYIEDSLRQFNDQVDIVIIHPSLLARIVLVLIALSLLTTLTLLPLPRFQHAFLRFAMSAAGTFGIVLSISLVAGIDSWAEVWERLWVADGPADWDNSKEKGMSAAFCFLLVAGVTSDWFLRRQFGENPDQKWDSYLADYSQNLPDRAGHFKPLTSFWTHLFASSKHPLSTPTDEITFPFNTDIKEQSTSLKPSSVATSRHTPSFPSYTNALRKGRSQRQRSRKDVITKARRHLKFGGNQSDSDSDVASTPQGVGNDNFGSIRPLSGLVTMDSGGKGIDVEKAMEQVKGDFVAPDSLDYSDYEDDITSASKDREAASWSPEFLRRHSVPGGSSTTSRRTAVNEAKELVAPAPIMSTPLGGAVPVTPSLIQALDRLAVAQQDAFGASSQVRPGLPPSHASESVVMSGLPKPQPRIIFEGDNKSQRWDAFWNEVRDKAARGH